MFSFPPSPEVHYSVLNPNFYPKNAKTTKLTKNTLKTSTMNIKYKIFFFLLLRKDSGPKGFILVSINY